MLKPLRLDLLGPELLIGAHMLQNSLPTRTIEFFIKSFSLIDIQGRVSCTDLASVYGCTPQAATIHVRTLEKSGYLVRVHYRAWELSPNVKVALKRLQYAQKQMA